MDWMKILNTGLDMAKLATVGTPVGAVIAIADAVVDSRTKGAGVDNEEVIALLTTLSKSTHNKVDDKLLCMCEAYLKCEKS